MLFAGDRPRGTLYAVYSFLEDAVGCRWWSSKVSTIPSLPDLTVPEQHVRYVPPLEYRESFWMDAFDGDWAARNKSNGNSERLEDKHGGKVRYGGPFFVHTFCHAGPAGNLLQGASGVLQRGRRPALDGYAQVCVTNEAVKKLITAKVLAYLRKDPNVQIISVSQNDCDDHCQCADCKKLEEEEGSPAGPLLHLVNYVAAEVGKQYPHVAIDTLAYQYTRQPPRHVKPLPNVIVRLCSIECDFAHPLTAKSNRTFADDIRGWSKLCRRLYIWDYTTNFGHYIQPHPNLRVLGPNIRFFVDHGVRGIFEQGGYTSLGAEFAELKAWVLAKSLWNPRLDDRALVRQFVHGYYGAAAAPMLEYIKLIHDEAEAKNTYLTCGSPPTAEFLNMAMLAKADKLLDQAEAAAKDNPAVLQRVQVARLPLRYVWATRWYEFQDQAAREKLSWPGPADYVQNCRTFLDIAKSAGVTMISEGALLAVFERRTIGMGRTASPPPPGCEVSPPRPVDRPAGLHLQPRFGGHLGDHREGRVGLGQDGRPNAGEPLRMGGATVACWASRWPRTQPMTSTPRSASRRQAARAKPSAPAFTTRRTARSWGRSVAPVPRLWTIGTMSTSSAVRSSTVTYTCGWRRPRTRTM